MTRCFGRRRAGEEHGPLGSDEPGSSDRGGARRDDPRLVGLARCGAFEAANQDRRSAAASDCENEPARPAKDDPLGTRLREERESTSLSDLRGWDVADTRRRACGTFERRSRSRRPPRSPLPRPEPSPRCRQALRERRASAETVGVRRGTSTAHMLAVGEPTALSSSKAGSWTTGMSGTVVTGGSTVASGPVGSVVRRIARTIGVDRRTR